MKSSNLWGKSEESLLSFKQVRGRKGGWDPATTSILDCLQHPRFGDVPFLGMCLKITKGYFKQPPPGLPTSRPPLGLLAGVQPWARCTVQSHKPPVLSPAFLSTRKERMLKSLCTKETPLPKQRGPFIVRLVSEGEKGQREAAPTGGGAPAGKPAE